MDKIKHACHATNKRLAASMQGTGMDLEKRLVRNITILLLSNIFDYEFFGHIIAKLSWSVTDSGKIRN